MPASTSSAIQIGSVGVGYHHERGFTIDRPQGSREAVFIHFLTPVDILLAKEPTRFSPGTCILYEPGFRQWYCGHDIGLGNDWFHATGTGVAKLARMYDIPFNVPFRPYRTDFVASYLRGLRDELARPDHLTPRGQALLLERLFLELARGLRPPTNRQTPHEREQFDAFQALRTHIHDEPQTDWTVARMAKCVNLSRTRFTVLFTLFFKVSPREDLIQARLNRAKWLLMSTTQKVATVAAQSGFDSIFHFTRLFHRRVGCTPSTYASRTTSSQM